MSSVTLNLAEGMGEVAGSRTRHYRIALGSMREVLAGLETAVALGYLGDIDRELLDRIDRVCATLFKLTRSLS